MANDVRAGLERQIAKLKAEMSRMAKALAARAPDAIKDAGAAAGALRDHPAATAAALSTIGLSGPATGFMPGGLRR